MSARLPPSFSWTTTSVRAVRLGRRIYDNLRKATGFMFAVQVPIAGLALMPLALGLPILFGPIHIAFIEMVIDPVCSLVFEAESEEEDVMRRQPRPQSASMAPASLIAWSLFQGLFAFSIVAGVLFVGLRRGMPVDEVRALTFFALVLTSVGLILAHRAFSAFGRDGIAPSQPSPRLDSRHSGGDPGSGASVAVRDRSLPLRPATPGRSGPYGCCRRRRVHMPRSHQVRSRRLEREVMRLSRGGPTIAWRVLAPQMLADELDMTPALPFCTLSYFA